MGFGVSRGSARSNAADWGVTIAPPVDEGEGPRLAPSAALVDGVRPYVRRG